MTVVLRRRLCKDKYLGKEVMRPLADIRVMCLTNQGKVEIASSHHLRDGRGPCRGQARPQSLKGKPVQPALLPSDAGSPEPEENKCLLFKPTSSENIFHRPRKIIQLTVNTTQDPVSPLGVPARTVP